MYELSVSDLLFSFVLTWVIGLAPPVLIRFTLLKHPMEKKFAIGTCFFFWVLNIVLFTALGSKSKTHAALLLIAFVSYAILRHQDNSPNSGAVSVHTKLNPALFLNRLGGWERLFVVVSFSWLLIATTTYFLALDGNSFCASFIPRSAFTWVVDILAPPGSVSDLLGIPVFSGLGFSTFLIAPVVLLWCAAYIGVRVFRWVRAGFQP